MITFLLDYSDTKQAEPKATLEISREVIEEAYLSVACRTARNRTALYQQKHAGAEMATRRRDPTLAALNRPISEHYELLQEQIGPLKDRRVIAFTISDLTANPLRPHYDDSIPDEQRAFQVARTILAVYRNGLSAKLFHLEDEPITEVPYTLLFSYEEEGQTRLAIHHKVEVNADGSLPEQIPKEIRNGLKWWAACPPLLKEGKHCLEEFAVLDYDIRHVFGFPEKDSAEEEELRKIYETFPSWEDWCKGIREKLRSFESPAVGSHAALGISEQELIVIHRTDTIPKIAEELKNLGMRDAVLLDSGGSCAIWANWANGGQGGILANHFNFRPARGAVIFLVLKGERYPEYAKG